MLTIKFLYGVLFFACLFSSTILSQSINGEYKFPLRPGMPEWRTLKTHDDMLKVLQLPSNVLTSISTDSLAHTCLNYPLFLDIWAFDNIQKGFKHVRKGFNGFEELFLRKDAHNIISKIYMGIDPSKIIDEKTPLKKGTYQINICKLEILLSQEELLQNISLNEGKELLQNMINKNTKMSQYAEYGIMDIETNVYLMLKILLKSNSKLVKKMVDQKNIKDLLSNGKLTNIDTANDIILIAKNYLNEQ